MPTTPENGFHARHMDLAEHALTRVQIILLAGGYIRDPKDVEKLTLAELGFVDKG